MEPILDSVRAASEAAPLRTTMLSLVTRLHDEIDDADEVARTAAAWIRTGRVVLTGNFKGRRDFEVDRGPAPARRKRPGAPRDTNPTRGRSSST